MTAPFNNNITNLQITDAMRKEEKKSPNALIASPVIDQIGRTLHPKDIYLAVHSKYGPDAIPDNISAFPPDFILEFSTTEMRNQILAQEYIEGPWTNGLPSFILSLSPWTNDYQSTDETVNQWAPDPSTGIDMNDALNENDPVAFEDPDVVRELFEKQLEDERRLEQMQLQYTNNYSESTSSVSTAGCSCSSLCACELEES